MTLDIAFANPGGEVLAVKVEDSNGNPIKGVFLEVMGQPNGKTDGCGQAWTPLGAGRFGLRFSKEGFEPQEVEIEKARGAASVTVTLEAVSN